MKTRSCTLRETDRNSISASQTIFSNTKKRASKGIMRRENNHVKTRTKMKANDESAIAFKTEQELDTKVPPRNDTPVENKKFACSICDKLVDNAETLRRHIREHLNIREVICGVAMYIIQLILRICTGKQTTMLNLRENSNQ
ncbi:unnamed protein product [Mucor hiemalis]